MTFSELANFLQRVLPSGESFVGSISVQEYKMILVASAIAVSFLIFIIVYLIKSTSVNLPRLTEFGMFLILIGMVSVADRLWGAYSDPFASALTWFFICFGFIAIFISAVWQYFEVCAKIRKKGERASDFLPLEIPEEARKPASAEKEFKFVAPKGVLPPEEWRG